MRRSVLIVVLVLYAALIGSVTAGVFYARDVVAPQLDTEKGQRDWDAWRRETADQAAGKGPVTRREQKSREPPLVVLMRDYFAVCLTGALVFASLLFAVMVFLVQGILRTPAKTKNRLPPPGRAAV
ncbi:MAG: hypothetical protein DCC68_20440 [Planctomycetota bacterium]|nr:MAG: hypothetical protein DCC68_20440 [Planctomycetota bacterium]